MKWLDSAAQAKWLWRYEFLRCHWVNPKLSQQKHEVKSLTREWSSEKDRLCCAGRGDDPLLITPPPSCASTKLSNLLKSAKSSCFSTLACLTSNLSLLLDFSSWRLGVVGSLLVGGTPSPVWENKYLSGVKSHSRYNMKYTKHTRKTVTDHISKHREENWKHDA